ncbi:unnamed protein product [Mytilus edulis]|uniref:Uncharacterized protein n=1 Tax=Mytilus edulis TaxID=6550 RepID=A0A8S3R2H6_MYTED|nr:unnamed protein product [Mytilus edulis]
MLSQRTFYKHNQQEYIQILNDNMREIQEEVVTCRRVVSNMQDRVLNLEDNVASVQQNVLDIEERLPDHHIPPHIKRSQNEIIENWKQNNSVYIKDTHGFCQAFEMFNGKTETKGCVYDSCGLNQGTSIRRIQDALEQMIGTYVTRVGDCYSLIHDSLFDILAYHYGRRVNDFPEIITYLPSNFISNRLCVDSDQADDEFSIQTPEDQFDRLAERLYRDLYDLKFYEVFRTKSLLHELFIKIFIEILENKSYESFKKVFLSFQRNVSCERPRDIDGTVHYLLTDFVFLEDKHERCCIRAISWVVYFGHLKLLKYIINRVRDKEGSCKSVFGIEKIEQTRLLVLCCYRNDENMTRLLLNNLDRDCINRNLRTINMNYNVQNSHRYYTPLIAACERGNLSIVKLLVENGAEIDTLDPQELSPLSVAYYNGHIKIVNFILNKRRPQDKKVILVFKQPVDENTERIVTCNPTEWPLITVKSQSRTQPCEKNQSSLMTKRDNQKPSQGKRYERKEEREHCLELTSYVFNYKDCCRYQNNKAQHLYVTKLRNWQNDLSHTRKSP